MSRALIGAHTPCKFVQLLPLPIRSPWRLNEVSTPQAMQSTQSALRFGATLSPPTDISARQTLPTCRTMQYSRGH